MMIWMNYLTNLLDEEVIAYRLERDITGIQRRIPVTLAEYNKALMFRGNDDDKKADDTEQTSCDVEI